MYYSLNKKKYLLKIPKALIHLHQKFVKMSFKLEKKYNEKHLGNIDTGPILYIFIF